MKTSFFEFNVAMSGLFTAKNGLGVTGHNIANASNARYSRQIALQKASTPLGLNNGRGMVGTGSEVYGIGQIRSFYLDKKYWTKNSTLGEYNVKNQLLTLAETIFNPLAETGVNASFSDFFNTLKSLQTSAEDPTYRTNVLQTAKTLSTYINNSYENLQKQQSDINIEISATVSIVNSLGLKIRNLNEQIMKYESDGSNANDLRDQRAICIDELSKYVNIEVAETGNSLSVMINGSEFVKGLTMRGLEVRARTEKLNPEDVGGLYDIYWYGSNEKFDVYNTVLSGELKALIDMRDGNNRDNFKGTVDNISGLSADIASINYTPSAVDGIYKLTLDNLNQNLLDSGKIKLLNKNTNKYDEYSFEVVSENPDNTVTISIKESDVDSNIVSDPATFQSAYGNSKAASFYIDSFTLTLNDDTSRTDILQNGKINLTDPVTGLKKEFTYDSYIINSDGTISFTITDMKPADAAKYVAGSKAASAETTSYKGIPYYISRLNDMVRTFAKAINEGLDYNGDPIPGVTGHMNGYDINQKNKGYLLFTYTDTSGDQILQGSQGDYKNMTAGNFSVSSLLMQQPDLLAASSEALSGKSNNEVIINFSKVQTYNSLFREGNIYDYSIAISTEMGIDLKQASSFYDNYTDVVSAVDEQRMSIMSVDLDEEGMNLIRYEQLYQAAAKLINVIDRMYDTLINGLGA